MNATAQVLQLLSLPAIATNIVIPVEIDGLPVTNIGNHAFDGEDWMESVTIPDSITTIGANAFYVCCRLENVTIPNSVTSIGESAFHGCEDLKSITIPGNVKEIGKYAFTDCLLLEDVTILDGVTSIGVSAFQNCNALTSVTIPNSVTSIYYNTFDDYEGTEEQWDQIYIDYTESIMMDAAKHQNSGASGAQPTPVPTVAPAQPTTAPTEAPAPQPTTAPQTGSFTDVPETHWAYDNIKRITELGGFNGYEDGTFKPDNQITHEEFLTVVMKLAYKGDVNAAPASALSDGWADWAKATLNAAAQAGIVTAEDTDLLATGTPITRAEMAKVISRTLDYLGKAKADNPDTSKITDWSDVAEAYRPYVAKVYAKGIISGYDDGSFGPARSLTRAEASAVIVRMIDAK